MPQKVGELAKTLPYYPKELPLVLVSVKDLKINMHALSCLPEDGIPNDVKVIESVNEDVGSDDDIDEDSSIDYEEIVYNESTETSSVIPDISHNHSF
ncbi:Hypothetical predicted protein [Paramuricea clavata]|uniref:Uncharacterized protein n=1 Tax=Paramuricea clavata TaxID=317549 RepID=A0A6S7LIP3_PARCT|nr:Hypothetical predicted protein [Paramuricea clavata]